MRCSARRRRAAATISIARVILWMFLIDAMRFLTSAWLAAITRSQPPSRRPRRRSRRPPRRPRRARVVTRSESPPSSSRVAVLVEVVAEVVGELLDRGVELLDGAVLPVAARDLLEQVGLLRAQALARGRRGTRGCGRRRCGRGSRSCRRRRPPSARRPAAASARSGSARRRGARRGPACAGSRGRGRSRTGRTPRARGTARGRASGGRRRFFIGLICALPPTRDTEMPTLMAGRTPEKNSDGSRKICPSVIEMTFVGM